MTDILIRYGSLALMHTLGGSAFACALYGHSPGIVFRGIVYLGAAIAVYLAREYQQ